MLLHTKFFFDLMDPCQLAEVELTVVMSEQNPG